LDSIPGEIMMVAAHSYDLDAAKSASMNTAFVLRPAEDVGQSAQTVPDLTADDFNDLADQLLA
jgi:2-haloacid dehalogenase